MITGMMPFDSEHQAGFIFKRLSEDPPAHRAQPPCRRARRLDRAVRKGPGARPGEALPRRRHIHPGARAAPAGRTAAETREIPITSSPARGPSPCTAAPRSTSTELSRAEKDDLLAQIERAARRVQENASEMARIGSLGAAASRRRGG